MPIEKDSNIQSQEMRINRFISEKGVCSRREADKLIEQGRITINGQVAQIGSQVSPGDEIKVDGKPIKKKDVTIYIALNKPPGIICTTDTDIRDNIIDFMSYPVRIFPIGRLDRESEGLILLTNDGDIVNKILRAGNNHEKEYIVTVDKPITGAFVRGMSEGVRILGTITKKCRIEQLSRFTFKIILTQGLNRQIRRMCEVFGYQVTRLMRIRIMNVKLDEMPSGAWRYLTDNELKTLFKLTENSHTNTQYKTENFSE